MSEKDTKSLAELLGGKAYTPDKRPLTSLVNQVITVHSMEREPSKFDGADWYIKMKVTDKYGETFPVGTSAEKWVELCFDIEQSGINPFPFRVTVGKLGNSLYPLLPV